MDNADIRDMVGAGRKGIEIKIRLLRDKTKVTYCPVLFVHYLTFLQIHCICVCLNSIRGDRNRPVNHSCQQQLWPYRAHVIGSPNHLLHHQTPPYQCLIKHLLLHPLLLLYQPYLDLAKNQLSLSLIPLHYLPYQSPVNRWLPHLPLLQYQHPLYQNPVCPQSADHLLIHLRHLPYQNLVHH